MAYNKLSGLRAKGWFAPTWIPLPRTGLGTQEVHSKCSVNKSVWLPTRLHLAGDLRSQTDKPNVCWPNSPTQRLPVLERTWLRRILKLDLGGGQQGRMGILGLFKGF